MMNFEEYWNSDIGIDTTSGDAEWLKGVLKNTWNDAIDEAAKAVSRKDYEGIEIYPHLIESIKELKG